MRPFPERWDVAAIQQPDEIIRLVAGGAVGLAAHGAPRQAAQFLG